MELQPYYVQLSIHYSNFHVISSDKAISKALEYVKVT